MLVATRGSQPLLSYRPKDAFHVVQLDCTLKTGNLPPSALYLCCSDKIFHDATSVIDSTGGASVWPPGNCQTNTRISVTYPRFEEDVFETLPARPELKAASLAVIAKSFRGTNNSCADEGPSMGSHQDPGRGDEHALSSVFRRLCIVLRL